jgi:hypothetical protein
MKMVQSGYGTQSELSCAHHQGNVLIQQDIRAARELDAVRFPCTYHHAPCQSEVWQLERLYHVHLPGGYSWFDIASRDGAVSSADPALNWVYWS